MLNKKTEYVDELEMIEALDPTLTVERINRYTKNLNPNYTGA